VRKALGILGQLRAGKPNHLPKTVNVVQSHSWVYLSEMVSQRRIVNQVHELELLPLHWLSDEIHIQMDLERHQDPDTA
jgi:hypothetical protein